MHYKVTGIHIDVGESLQRYVKSKLSEIIEKYSTRPTNATIIFTKDSYNYVCEIMIHLSTGLNVSAKSHTTEIYASFDQAAERIEKQLRRYKRRLKDHHKQRTTPIESFDASAYILVPDDEHDEKTNEDLSPVIIAEMQTGIKTLSVGEAVMQLELTDETALVFKNASHNGINVVYKRKDNNIGWIDPSNLK